MKKKTGLHPLTHLPLSFLWRVPFIHLIIAYFHFRFFHPQPSLYTTFPILTSTNNILHHNRSSFDVGVSHRLHLQKWPSKLRKYLGIRSPQHFVLAHAGTRKKCGRFAVEEGPKFAPSWAKPVIEAVAPEWLGDQGWMGQGDLSLKRWQPYFYTVFCGYFPRCWL